MASPSSSLSVLLVGGPTAVLDYAGLRLLTDPTFDPPGDQAGGLTKLTGPAVGADDVGAIDAVLLSHDQHSDNLDVSGRAFLARAGRTLTTVDGRRALGRQRRGPRALGVDRARAPGGQRGHGHRRPGAARPRGLRARDRARGRLRAHGRRRCRRSTSAATTPPSTSCAPIAERLGPIELAVLFAGAVSIPQRFDGAYLTLSADAAAQAAQVLGARAVVPVHFEGWGHFTQGSAEVREAFESAGIGDRLVVPERGASVSV